VTALNKATSDDVRATLKGQLLAGGVVLGLLATDTEAWFKWTPDFTCGLTEDEIEALIKARAQARDDRNFAEADRIRDTLAEAGVVLEDKAEGTIWRRAG
jgi:cysteinyl-tRNA synthetase